MCTNHQIPCLKFMDIFYGVQCFSQPSYIHSRFHLKRAIAAIKGRVEVVDLASHGFMSKMLDIILFVFERCLDNQMSGRLIYWKRTHWSKEFCQQFRSYGLEVITNIFPQNVHVWMSRCHFSLQYRILKFNCQNHAVLFKDCCCSYSTMQ